jgi:hypothetical protein
MTTEHILQDCPQHAELQRKTWLTSADLKENLSRRRESLKRTTNFVTVSGVSIWLVIDEEDDD